MPCRDHKKASMDSIDAFFVIHIELSRTNLQREDADAGAVGEDDVSVYDFHAAEEVVCNQEIAVQIAEVDGRGELGGCRDGT